MVCQTYLIINTDSPRFLLKELAVTEKNESSCISSVKMVLYFPLALNYDFLVYVRTRKGCVDEAVLRAYSDYADLVRIANEHVVKPLRRTYIINVCGDVLWLRNYTLEKLPLATLGVLLWLDDGHRVDELSWMSRDIGLMVEALVNAGFIKDAGSGWKLLVDRGKVLGLVREKLWEEIQRVATLLPLVYYYDRDRLVEVVERVGEVKIPNIVETKKYYVYAMIAKDYVPEQVYEASAIYGLLMGKKFAEYYENIRENIEILTSRYLSGANYVVDEACAGRYGVFTRKYLNNKGVCIDKDKILEVRI